ncbi:MAG TPA: FCD domain-containing protein [Thermohalobaculum sp.]|nr:FCD domain-containing protein [Thermohalobaculum sp.]
MPFQKIVAGKISSAVARQVEELILQGVLRPGDRLPAERELAETVDVSRPTLREALADLEARGLVVTRPGGGTFIAEVLGSAFAPPLIELFASHDTALFDYVEFRRDLEGLAAERAAVNANEADLATIDSVFRRMEEAAQKRDPAEEAALDAEFHMAVVEAAHNVIMLHMMRSLYELLVRGVFYNRAVVYALPEQRSRLLDQHRAIRDAVLARDPCAARAAAEAHLSFIAEALRDAHRVRSREQVSALRRRHEELRGQKPRTRKVGV